MQLEPLAFDPLGHAESVAETLSTKTALSPAGLSFSNRRLAASDAATNEAVYSVKASAGWNVSQIVASSTFTTRVSSSENHMASVGSRKWTTNRASDELPLQYTCRTVTIGLVVSLVVNGVVY